jgi:hypothetical protein
MMIVTVISRGPTDVCTLLRAKCVTYLGLDGSHLVLQEVSDADDYCHGQCNAGKGFALMLCVFWRVKSGTKRTTLGSSACMYPSGYLVVLRTLTKALR